MFTDARDRPAVGDAEESELVHEPPEESPVKRWMLLDGHRLVISAGIAVGVFLAVVGLFAADLLDVTDDGAVVNLLGSLVGGTLPFITIVLAINQLVLSQELGWANELRDRFEGMTGFRRDVERLTDEPVSPPAPAEFLDLVIRTTGERAEQLPEALVDDPNRHSGRSGSTREAVHRLAAAVRSEGENVSETLQTAEFGTFEALAAVLGHHHGEHLYAARRLRAVHADAFRDSEPLDDLVELLEALAVARQTFKTLYIQHELAILSRLLLYVGFPTLVGGGLLVVAYPRIVEVVGSQFVLLLVAAGGVTLVFLPFVVLLSYSLRIATIAARTADFGPFVPRVS